MFLPLPGDLSTSFLKGKSNHKDTSNYPHKTQTHNSIYTLNKFINMEHHAHEVLGMMLGQTFTEESLLAAMRNTFGDDATY